MNWRQIQKTNISSIDELFKYLELDEINQQKIRRNSNFVLNLPIRIANKIKKNDLTDPLLRQFVPLIEEGKKTLGFVFDPVGDQKAQVSPSLLHKYQGRALLITTSACAMHCRYCFRQNYPYSSQDKTFQKEIEIIQNDAAIEELILSGGDPLSLSNSILEDLLVKLQKIPHLKRIRFHSRFIIGIPERVDEEFLNILKRFSFQYWFVVHVNHPLELDEDVLGALSKLQQLGIPILNQAVLLKGVNDQENILEQLFQKLANHGVYAYYLHQLDKIQGGAHFEVTEERGRELIKYLETRLPGYAVPKYVREVTGYPSKATIR